MHISAMRALGARENDGAFIAKRLIGADIVFDKISVGATVNAILLATAAEGKSRIFGYAKEPHVIALVEFLRGAGADIIFNGDCMEIEGAKLHGSSARIIPDMIEAGTYAALSLLTDSKLKISGIEREHLSPFFDAFTRGGACLSFSDNSVTVSGALDTALDIVTEPYPGFPTDLQPQTVPLMAKFCGGTVTERVWQERFGYLSELSRFGINYYLKPSFARISASKICAARAKAPDLRGGAAILMCALCAKGTSVVDSAEIIKRGYSDIVNKLRSVGAQIVEVF
jgi:UDP-N-acetylglucosamine 1-carboxyvinyltransferase